MGTRANLAFAIVFLAFFSGSAGVAGSGAQGVDLRGLPACLDQDGKRLLPNNRQVIAWKTSTPDHWLGRGFVVGTVVRRLKGNRDHLHLEVELGSGSSDPQAHVEVIYNSDFGLMPSVQEGSLVVACGDYITANGALKRYRVSPVGAIVHWVHASPRPAEHASGFLQVDGVLYGMDDPRNGTSSSEE